LGRLNTRQLEKWIPFLIMRDGKICSICKTPIEQLTSKVQIDHIDGNNENNPSDGKNFQLSCARCNRKKEKSDIANRLSDRPMTPEMERRDILKPIFLKEVNHRISEYHSCCVGEAIYDVTMVIGSSVQFGRDMIKQEIGTNGIWGIGHGNCYSPLCKKKHIYLKNEIPQDED
jgi:hypothetical protein